MSNALANAWNKPTKTFTENGALTFTDTGKAVLDYYSLAGAMRLHGGNSLPLFLEAYNENPVLALKALFYFRDVRKGQGERKLFRDTLVWLEKNKPFIFNALVSLVPEYGRWDDFLSFVKNDDVAAMVKAQLMRDIDSKNPSLLAKWMPSENASSPTTKKLARSWIQTLGLTAREYRKMLTHLRKKIGIVESAMSSGEWSAIEYSHVPSIAMKNYRKAFSKQDAERFVAYLESVKKGETKINSATLLPYDIYKAVMRNHKNDEVLEAQWSALPNYMVTDENVLVLADVSGSMSGDPMAVSVSLALYAAERTRGAFHNMFMTFESTPHLIKVKGKTLLSKMQSIENSPWGGSTDLQKAFELILDTATKNNVPQSDMPTKLFIVSDMEFNMACNSNKRTNFEQMQKKYRKAGYEMPMVVFWNVNARHNQSPVTYDENGTMLVSGLSPVIFKNALLAKTTTPYDSMLEVLNSERYAAIDQALLGKEL